VGWGHALAACALVGPPLLRLLLLSLSGTPAGCVCPRGDAPAASSAWDGRLWGWACAGAALWRPSLRVSQLGRPRGGSPWRRTSSAARGRAAVWWAACAAAALGDGSAAAAAACLLAGGVARQRAGGGGHSVHAADCLAGLALALALACAVDDAWELGSASASARGTRGGATTTRRGHGTVEASGVWRQAGSAPKPGAAALGVARAALARAEPRSAQQPSAAPSIQPALLAPTTARLPSPPTAVLAPLPLSPPECSRALLEGLWRAAATVEGRRLAGLRTFFRMNPQLLPGALEAVALVPLPPAWLALLVEVECHSLDAPPPGVSAVDGDGSGASPVASEGSAAASVAGNAPASAASGSEGCDGAGGGDCEPPMGDNSSSFEALCRVPRVSLL
jgi:hypothetical protein